MSWNWTSEKVEYNLSEDERVIDKEIIELEGKIRSIQKQYDKLSRTNPKRIDAIKAKEEELKKLDKESRYYSNKRNELMNKLDGKETV